MRKVYIYSIIIVIFILSGCSNNNLNVSALEPSNIVIKEYGIKAELKEAIIKSSKENITLILENKTEYEYFYGVDFSLEIEANNTWNKVPFKEEPVFIEIAIILKANSKQEEVIDLYNYFGNLPEGKYRIIKSLYKDGEKVVVSAPFEIRNNK